jgi:hypothetical protein
LDAGSTKFDVIIFNGGLDRLTSNADIVANTWQYVTLVYNETSLSFYYNGTYDSSMSASGDVATSIYDVVIGKHSLNNVDYFDGKIDEVKIYNRSLSAEQIYANYQAGLSGHNVETIVSQETSVGDNWSCMVTPNDAYQDGTGVLSNFLKIIVGGDTCTYGGSGDWEVQCSDDCIITTDTSLVSNTLKLIGAGTFTNLANIYIDRLEKSNSCKFISKIGDGKKLNIKLS